MIKIENISKVFTDTIALDNVTLEIEEGKVFGLIGSNGAGKSTLLKIISGIIKEDEGAISVDGMVAYENTNAKEKIFYISDNQYFNSNSTPSDLIKEYAIYYSEFDKDKAKKLFYKFGINEKQKFSTFSKGVKKQLSILIGLSAKTKYLLCDETFDGLDPAMRQATKALFINEIEERGVTLIITSHNLRELEDICDNIGLIHRGGVILSSDLDTIKLGLHKIQCAFKKEYLKDSIEKINNEYAVLSVSERGSLLTLTIRGEEKQISDYIANLNPIFYETIPLSLEEIFISETEVMGYDIKNIISEVDFE